MQTKAKNENYISEKVNPAIEIVTKVKSRQKCESCKVKSEQEWKLEKVKSRN